MRLIKIHDKGDIEQNVNLSLKNLSNCSIIETNPIIIEYDDETSALLKGMVENIQMFRSNARIKLETDYTKYIDTKNIMLWNEGGDIAIVLIDMCNNVFIVNDYDEIIMNQNNRTIIAPLYQISLADGEREYEESTVYSYLRMKTDDEIQKIKKEYMEYIQLKMAIEKICQSKIEKIIEAIQVLDKIETFFLFNNDKNKIIQTKCSQFGLSSGIISVHTFMKENKFLKGAKGSGIYIEGEDLEKICSQSLQEDTNNCRLDYNGKIALIDSLVYKNIEVFKEFLKLQK